MPENTMKAIRVHEFGGPGKLVLDKVPRPEPGPGDVLVRVHAAGVNPADVHFREGFARIPEELRPALPLPYLPGFDVSGVVAAVGPDVTGLREGDEVFGLVRFPGLGREGGCYAEYVTSPASHLARKPAGLDHVQAAALPMAALTAHQFLTELMKPVDGRTVLVNGAAGGVGHIFVQLLKARNAHVIGVASGRHETFLRKLGVDRFIDYTTTALQDEAGDLEVVIDTVGGPAGRHLLSLVRPGGTLASIALGVYGPDLATERDITFVTGQVRSDGPQLAELAPLLDAGRLVPAIDAVHPLTEAAQAHARIAQGHLQGKLVLSVR